MARRAGINYQGVTFRSDEIFNSLEQHDGKITGEGDLTLAERRSWFCFKGREGCKKIYNFVMGALFPQIDPSPD